MTDPVNRTMLLVDIEKFSDRDDVEQAYLRRMLYDVVDSTMERAGIDETLRLRADQGDSLMEFIDPNIPVTQLLRTMLTEIPAQLRSRNRMSSRSAQMRLRAVLSTGYITLDERGIWVGSDLNHACRLLDADLLRQALLERPDDFALCVSESVHSGIVRHHHRGIPADEFRSVTVGSKNGPLPAWLLGPAPGGRDGRSGPPEPGTSGERPAPDRPSAAGTAAGQRTAGGPGPSVKVDFGGGSPNFGGSFVAGDQHGVSGGHVTGDVGLGGTVRGTEPTVSAGGGR